MFETVVIAPEKLSISGSFVQGEALTAVIIRRRRRPEFGNVRLENRWFWKFAMEQSNTVPNSFDVGKKVELTVRYQDEWQPEKIYQASSEQAIKVGNDAPSGTLL